MRSMKVCTLFAIKNMTPPRVMTVKQKYKPPVPRYGWLEEDQDGMETFCCLEDHNGKVKRVCKPIKYPECIVLEDEHGMPDIYCDTTSST